MTTKKYKNNNKHTKYFQLTCPRADKDLLIAAASTSRIPEASLRDILSEPAKSTKVRRPLLVALETVSKPSTFRVNRRCDLELWWNR